VNLGGFGRRFSYGIEVAFPLTVTSVAFAVAAHYFTKPELRPAEWTLLIGVPCGAALLFAGILMSSRSLSGQCKLEFPAPITFSALFVVLLAAVTRLFLTNPNPITAPLEPLQILGFWMNPIALGALAVIQSVVLAVMSRGFHRSTEES
jgi:hypothetical protein